MVAGGCAAETAFMSNATGNARRSSSFRQYRRYQAAGSKQPDATRFPGVTYGGSPISPRFFASVVGPNQNAAACLANVGIFVVPATGGHDNVGFRRQQIVLLSKGREQASRGLGFDLAA